MASIWFQKPLGFRRSHHEAWAEMWILAMLPNPTAPARTGAVWIIHGKEAFRVGAA